MTTPADEVARLFGASPMTASANLASELYPGLPGLVIAEGRVRGMTWGFPLILTGKQGQPLKPKLVNNARTDKLSGPFWRASLASRRCLIPVTAYAEAEGPLGAKTRTWITIPADAAETAFAVAGLWRPTAEWGDCYAMVIDEACVEVQHVHLRMPAILARSEWDRWLTAPPAEAAALCRPWEGAITVERTSEPWTRRSLLPGPPVA